jgi:hypothetical protein
MYMNQMRDNETKAQNFTTSPCTQAPITGQKQFCIITSAECYYEYFTPLNKEMEMSGEPHIPSSNNLPTS